MNIPERVDQDRRCSAGKVRFLSWQPHFSSTQPHGAGACPWLCAPFHECSKTNKIKELLKRNTLYINYTPSLRLFIVSRWFQKLHFRHKCMITQTGITYFIIKSSGQTKYMYCNSTKDSLNMSSLHQLTLLYENVWHWIKKYKSRLRSLSIFFQKLPGVRDLKIKVPAPASV